MTKNAKYIVCLGDGMADEPIPELDHLTPLQKAHTPNMDQIAKTGCSGTVKTVPGPFSPGSDVANMGIFGYDPQTYYTGRGPIEAASMGIQVPDGHIVFRCNLTTVIDNTMTDFTAGHISSEEAKAILEELNEKKLGIRFFPGVSYRHIALLPEKYLSLQCTAPHDITDQAITSYLPKGSNATELLELVHTCNRIIETSAVNKKRREQGQKPANFIWLWSQGRIPQLPSFQDRWGKTGGVVTAVDLLKGIAQLTQLKAPNIVGATGFTDTNYAAKRDAAFKILEDHDFVYIHIEAPDECGHMGNAQLKTQAIADFDREIVGPVLQYQQQHPNTRILVLPDHPTPCRIKTHTSDPVPFCINGEPYTKDNCSNYSENDSKNGSLHFQTPWDLMAYFLNK